MLEAYAELIPPSLVTREGTFRRPCPRCAKRPGDKTLGVTRKPDGSVIWHCFRCEWKGRLRPEGAGRQSIPEPKFRKESPPRTTLSPEWARFWQEECVPLAGTVAESYLQARACRFPPPDGDLLFCPELRHPSGHVGPALIGLVSNVLTAEPMSLHMTWVQGNGKKADVNPPRLLLKGHRKAGGVIRLWPDEDVTMGLGIAEGLETALGAAHAYTPVWAAIDAGNLAAFPILDGIECLTVFADRDKAGIEAVEKCAARWVQAGKEVSLYVPQDAEDKHDFNDLAMRLREPGPIKEAIEECLWWRSESPRA